MGERKESGKKSLSALMVWLFCTHIGEHKARLVKVLNLCIFPNICSLLEICALVLAFADPQKPYLHTAFIQLHWSWSCGISVTRRSEQGHCLCQQRFSRSESWYSAHKLSFLPSNVQWQKYSMTMCMAVTSNPPLISIHQHIVRHSVISSSSTAPITLIPIKQTLPSSSHFPVLLMHCKWHSQFGSSFLNFQQLRWLQNNKQIKQSKK